MGRSTQRTWENDFGDGYTQAGGIGINTKSETWNLTHSGVMAVGEELPLVRDFIDRHEGYKAFIWTPPGGVQGRYRCKGYKSKPLGAGLVDALVHVQTDLHAVTVNFTRPRPVRGFLFLRPYELQHRHSKARAG